MGTTPDTLAAPRRGSGELTAQLERHLSVVQHLTHIGSWEWQVSSDLVIWSDELYRIYGLAPQSCQITFDLFLSKLHPEDRERVNAEVQAALTRGGPFAYRERIVRADGELRTLDTRGEVLQDGAGAPARLIGTCRDITEEHREGATVRLYASIVENVQIALSVWCVPAPEDVGSATLVAYNPAAERVAGISLERAIGRSVSELFPAVLHSELPELLASVARSGAPRELPAYRFVAADKRWRTLSMQAFPLSGECVGIAIEDVTPQANARRLRAAEQHVLELLASDAPLPDVLSKLVLAIEEQLPETLGSILLLSAQGTHVTHAAAPRLPPEYCRAIDGQPIGPNRGSCGTAAFLGHPVFVTDIDSDPLWSDYRVLALSFGLRACWSMPIFASDGRVLGTFAFYYRERRKPGKEDLELIARAAHLAGIAIERRQLDDQARALSARLEAAREDERTAVAREIHDDLGQALTALKMDVAWLARRTAAEGPVDRNSIGDKLQVMSRMTDEIIDRVRRISAGLRPGVLDDLGLSAAIEWQAGEFEQRTDIQCQVRSDAEDARFGRDVSTAIFRIFQEALTNVARHAQARRVEVQVVRAAADRLRLEVRDDGKGITSEALASTNSLGLLGMRERARRLNGSVVVSAAPGGGTLVVAEVPLPPGEWAS
jgi:PAS domain S-box-containing protein